MAHARKSGVLLLITLFISCIPLHAVNYQFTPAHHHEAPDSTSSVFEHFEAMSEGTLMFIYTLILGCAIAFVSTGHNLASSRILVFLRVQGYRVKTTPNKFRHWMLHHVMSPPLRIA